LIVLGNQLWYINRDIRDGTVIMNGVNVGFIGLAMLVGLGFKN